MSDHGSLSKKTASAGLWTVSSKILSKIIDFVTLLLLARCLSPSDFGVVAMAMTAIYIIEAIFELPLSAALLQPDKLTDSMFDTAFTLGLLRGALIATILIAAAFPLSIAYGEPRLVMLTSALAFAPVFRGLINPRMVIFVKALDFRKDAIVEFAGKLTSLTIATSIALTTESYWAIAFGTIAGPAAMMIVSYFLVPKLPRLTISEWAHFSDMIGWNMLSQIVSALNWQLDRLILPRYIKADVFGRFSTANDISAIPHQAISIPIMRPVLSALSAARRNNTLQEMYIKIVGVLTIMLAPIFMFLALMAKPMLVLALGEKWASAAPLLQGMAIANMLAIPAVPMGALAMALNRTKFVTKRTFWEFAFRVPLTLVGIHFLFAEGAILAKGTAAAVGSLAAMYYVRDLCGIPISSQIMSICRPVLALLPGSLFAIFVSQYIAYSSHIVLIAQLTCIGLIFVILYLIVLQSVWALLGKPSGGETTLERFTVKFTDKLLGLLEKRGRANILGRGDIGAANFPRRGRISFSLSLSQGVSIGHALVLVTILGLSQLALFSYSQIGHLPHPVVAHKVPIAAPKMGRLELVTGSTPRYRIAGVVPKVGRLVATSRF